MRCSSCQNSFLHVFIPVCLSLLRFPRKNHSRFVITLFCFVWSTCAIHVICNYFCTLVSNTISISDDVRVSKVTSGIRTANPSRASEFTPVFSVVRIGQSLASYVVLCWSLVVLLSFLFWLLYCLSFIELRPVITTLASWNFSFIMYSQSVILES